MTLLQRQLTIAILLPLNLCGLFLVVGPTKQMPMNFQWQIRLCEVVLAVPGIAFMLITIPLHTKTCKY